MYKQQILISAAMALFLCNPISHAKDSGFKYEDAGDHIIIIKYEGGASRVTIPATIDGKPVSSIRHGALRRCDTLSEIVLPASLEHIDHLGIYQCQKLKAIKVDPKNPNFTSEDGILFNKDKSILIQAPNALKGAYTVPNSVEEIGLSAFSYCERLNKIILAPELKKINEYAFSRCENLKAVDFPESLTAIGSSAFSGCPLSEVKIPANVSEIGAMAFQGCTKLIIIQVDKKNTTYCSKDNSIFSKDMSTLVMCPPSFEGTYKFPAGTTKIGERAFCHCKKLRDVHIPEGVLSIGEQAFWDCSNLGNITFPSSLTSLGDRAFGVCLDLERAYFLGDAPSMDNDVFVSCDDGFRILYKEGAKGFTSPQWKGYPSRIDR